MRTLTEAYAALTPSYYHCSKCGEVFAATPFTKSSSPPWCPNHLPDIHMALDGPFRESPATQDQDDGPAFKK